VEGKHQRMVEWKGSLSEGAMGENQNKLKALNDVELLCQMFFFLGTS
jgi:hypothetical protein